MSRTVVQNERLLSAKESASRLGISQAMFYRMLAKLRASGLKQVLLPSQRGNKPLKRYSASSLEAMIARAAEREAPIC